MTKERRGVEQSGCARLAHNQENAGSNPAPATNFALKRLLFRVWERNRPPFTGNGCEDIDGWPLGHNLDVWATIYNFGLVHLFQVPDDFGPEPDVNLGSALGVMVPDDDPLDVRDLL